MQLKLYQLLLFYACFSFLQANGQEKFTDDLNFMVNTHYGYNLPEYPLFNTIVNDHIQSFDFTLYKETKGKKIWEQLYKYPDYGISFFYSSPGNDKILGKEYVLSLFFRLYYLSFERTRLYSRIGVGAGYATKVFEIDRNYLNVAVGSHLNIHFNYRFGAVFQLSNKLKLNAGLAFDHFSNGNTAEPNVGVNYLTFYGGLGYLVGQKSPRIEREPEPHQIENHYTIYASVGGKHTRSLASDYFLASSLSFEFIREFFRKIHFGVGADMFYDSSVKHDFLAEERTYKNQYSYQTGIHLTQRIVYNRFSLSIQEGFYLGLKEKRENYKMYNRV